MFDKVAGAVLALAIVLVIAGFANGIDKAKTTQPTEPSIIYTEPSEPTTEQLPVVLIESFQGFYSTEGTGLERFKIHHGEEAPCYTSASDALKNPTICDVDLFNTFDIYTLDIHLALNNSPTKIGECQAYSLETSSGYDETMSIEEKFNVKDAYGVTLHFATNPVLSLLLIEFTTNSSEGGQEKVFYCAIRFPQNITP